MELGLVDKNNGVQRESQSHWEQKRIKGIAPLQRGFDLTNSQLKKGEYPVVYSNGIVNHHNEYMVKAPGVVTGRSGTIGKFTFVTKDYWPHNTSLWVTDFKGNDPLFVYYLYSSIGIERFSTGSGVPTLNRNDVHDYQVYIPPTVKEQQAIATVLSDTDRLIQALERKIEKKKFIKEGVLQKLLVPKPDWENCLLGEAVEFLDHKRLPIKSGDRSGMKGVYPYYGASGIIDYVNDYIFDEELILLGEDGENILSRNLPLAFKVTGKVWVNNHAHVMKPSNEFDIDFLTAYLESLDYSLLNSGTAQPKLNKKTCHNISILKPSLEEQRSIATILNDIDKELSDLGEKLSKYFSLKRGLMQQLLTGKIRLV